MKTKRAYKERFYPTTEQEQLLAQSFGCTRFVYNNTLRFRTDVYYKDGGSVSHSQAEKRLVSLKSEFPWLSDISSVPLQQCLRDQQEAFKNFWAGRAKYPNFKKRHSKQSIRLTKAAFRLKEGQLFIAKSKEPLNIRWSRELSSEPSSITISKDRAGRYFVSMLCDFEAKPMPIRNKTVGIDLGLTDLFITSDGKKSGNPKFTKRYEQNLAYLQRKLAKKQKGSKNRAKVRLKVARLHAKIADCRMDATHKASRKLINENQVICVENLAVKNMIKNPKLAKHIADANWGEFVRQLQYKAGWADCTVAEIDRFLPSSKRCSSCGFIHESLPLSIREWDCPECKTHHDRDINAAINIKTAGLAGLACGATETGIAA
ncbi:RNA-guided endonuclease InsQ/TnpB family protein [Endozoicomonas numazuensis]|uniref:Transposase n=1 Tax=Endozoicomonas numazuensis TaxID=1137799 RepID=A0A081NLA8_9GAMM|nr:RNA-guided endonuclease TnpB family protein [Endozoicomonas numazuensis]KEQ19231.1 transposase [Endozoicomonas numazuensis]